MPYAAKKVCQQPGCGALCEERYCVAHARNGVARGQSRKSFDDQRGSAHARGYGRQWRKLRLVVLARDPLCRIQIMCGRGVGHELPAASTDADHIVPKPAGDDSLDNLQGACHECHSWKTATKDSNFARLKRAR